MWQLKISSFIFNSYAYAISVTCIVLAINKFLDESLVINDRNPYYTHNLLEIGIRQHLRPRYQLAKLFKIDQTRGDLSQFRRKFHLLKRLFWESLIKIWKERICYPVANWNEYFSILKLQEKSVFLTQNLK